MPMRRWTRTGERRRRHTSTGSGAARSAANLLLSDTDAAPRTRSRTLLALCAGIILGFCGALAGGVLADRPRGRARGRRAAALPWQEASLFAEVYERIKREYVDEVDDHALMEKAMRGMVAALDPHSAYLDSEEFEEIRLSTMGSYPGVGIEVVADGRRWCSILQAHRGLPGRSRPGSSPAIRSCASTAPRSARTSPAPSRACAGPPGAWCA